MKLQANTPDYKKLADEELIFRYVHRNEPVAIEILFERYGHLVLGICLDYYKNRNSALQHMEQIFVRLIDEVPKVKLTHFKSWFYSLVHNYCQGKIYAKVKVKNNSFVTNVSEEEWQYKIEDENLYPVLEDIISKLPPNQQKSIKLFYLQNLPVNIVAEQTNQSVEDTIKAIKAARSNIKKKLLETRKVK